MIPVTQVELSLVRVFASANLIAVVATLSPLTAKSPLTYVVVLRERSLVTGVNVGLPLRTCLLCPELTSLVVTIDPL